MTSTLTRSTLRPVGGSTVHHGTYCCEVFSCFDEWIRRPAAWSCWRIRNGRVVATWIICEEHLPLSQEIDCEIEGWTHLYLPLILPAHEGATHAVRSMGEAIARLGVAR